MFQESVSIHIAEPAIAPSLYLETSHSLDAPHTSPLYTGRVVVGYEGNNTHQNIGVLHLCDLNVDDVLDVMHMSRSDNVSYELVDVSTTDMVAADDDLIHLCLQANLR